MEQNKSRRKILYIITKSNWGGAQRHIYDIATHLDPHHFDVTVALGGNGALKEKLQEKNIKTVSIDELGRSVHVLKDFTSFKKIYAIIRDVRPDIIHLHSPKAAGLGALAGRVLKVPHIIYTVHGWTFNESINPFSQFFIWLFSWATALLSHTLITLSASEAKQACNFPFINKKKVFTIPNGIGTVTILERQEARRFIEEKTGEKIQDYECVIGSIGELHKNKGYLCGLKAFSEIIKDFPRAKWFIIGEGEQRAEIEAYRDAHNLHKNVFLLGHIMNAITYASAFNIFLFPSQKEGLPYALLEAGKASLPIIASDVGGISSIIKQGESGILVRSGNSKEIVNAIRFYIDHEEERKKMGHALHKEIQRSFNLETMIARLKELYC